STAFRGKPAGEIQRVPPGEERGVFQQLAGAADYSIVIAPEFDDILLERCRWVQQAGGRSLGPSLDAVRLTSAKLTLADRLARHGVPTPPILAAGNKILEPHGLTSGLVMVVKPRFGAGSQATAIVGPGDDVDLVKHIQLEMPDAEFVIQPYAPGRAASVAFL